MSRRTGAISYPEGDRGCRETSGTAQNRPVWQTRKRWLAAGLHLIADIRYEMSAAVQATPTSASEHVILRRMLSDTFAKPPEVAA